MNLLGNILLGCLVIAALQGILAVLAVATVAALMIGVIWRPQIALPIVFVMLLLRALELYPVQTLLLCGSLGLALLIGSGTKRPPTDAPRGPILLPGPRPDPDEGSRR